MRGKIKEEHLVYAAFLLGFVVALVMLILHFKFVFVAAIIIVLHTFLRRYTLVNLPVELEFVTLGTVVFTLVFGLNEGIVFALACPLIGDHFNRGINLGTLFMIIGYVIGAVAASVFGFLNIVILGLFVTLVVHACVFTIFHFTGHTNPVHNTLYSGSNIVFNSYMFYKVAPFLIGILT